MKCNKCKVNDADIFIGYLKSNPDSTICLCDTCSTSAGIAHHLILDNLCKSDSKDEEQLTVDYELKCPMCLTEIKAFLSTGQIGCSHCYLVFKKEIDRFFRHDSVRNLYGQLQDAIVEENFEYAATLRDRIKVLSSGEMNELVEN